MMRFLTLFLGMALFLVADVGKFMSVFGTVTVVREGAAAKVTDGALMQSGDEIVTGSDGRVSLVFEDGTKMILGRNGHLVLTDVLLKEMGIRLNVSLSQGVFRTVTGRIGKVAPERFKIETKTGAIGIRGTDFAGQVAEDHLGVLYIGRGNGVVITNASGEAVLDQPGEGVFFTAGDQPPRPGIWDREASEGLLAQLDSPELAAAELTFLDRWRLFGSLFVRFEQGTFYHGDETRSKDADREKPGAVLTLETPVWHGFDGQFGWMAGDEEESVNILGIAALRWRGDPGRPDRPFRPLFGDGIGSGSGGV